MSTLYFPEGTYIIESPEDETFSILHFGMGNIKVCGDGAGVSIIKIGDVSPTYDWLFGPDTVAGFELCNLTIDYNFSECLVGLYAGTDADIHDIEIINVSEMYDEVFIGSM